MLFGSTRRLLKMWALVRSGLELEVVVVVPSVVGVVVLRDLYEFDKMFWMMLGKMMGLNNIRAIFKPLD